MQHITVIGLDVGDFEVSQPVDHDVACVVFLSTRFRIEACSIKDDSKSRVFWDYTRRLNKVFLVKDGLDNGIYISKV